MPLTRIRELYVVELSEIYESEREILRQLPLMAARSSSNTLREAFEAHYRTTLCQVDRLDEIFGHLDERRRPTSAPAIRGLVEETRLRQACLERGNLLDLELVNASRRIGHYEMAAYRGALAYATRLSDAISRELLLRALEEERQMDERLELFLVTPPVPVTRATIA
jgi:ferritin-like metal-binding protein YciE